MGHVWTVKFQIFPAGYLLIIRQKNGNLDNFGQNDSHTYKDKSKPHIFLGAYAVQTQSWKAGAPDFRIVSTFSTPSTLPPSFLYCNKNLDDMGAASLKFPPIAVNPMVARLHDLWVNQNQALS